MDWRFLFLLPFYVNHSGKEIKMSELVIFLAKVGTPFISLAIGYLAASLGLKIIREGEKGVKEWSWKELDKGAAAISITAFFVSPFLHGILLAHAKYVGLSTWFPSAVWLFGPLFLSIYGAAAIGLIPEAAMAIDWARTERLLKARGRKAIPHFPFFRKESGPLLEKLRAERDEILNRKLGLCKGFIDLPMDEFKQEVDLIGR
jgi:hypothetical protein